MESLTEESKEIYIYIFNQINCCQNETQLTPVYSVFVLFALYYVLGSTDTNGKQWATATTLSVWKTHQQKRQYRSDIRSSPTSGLTSNRIKAISGLNTAQVGPPISLNSGLSGIKESERHNRNVLIFGKSNYKIRIDLAIKRFITNV